MAENEKLVERVAEAIYASEGNCYTDDARMFQPFPWEELDDDDYQCVREGYRAKARAAIAECDAALTLANARLARLEEALKPFGGLADKHDEYGDDDDTPAILGKLMASDLRRARSALKGDA